MAVTIYVVLTIIYIVVLNATTMSRELKRSFEDLEVLIAASDGLWRRVHVACPSQQLG